MKKKITKSKRVKILRDWAVISNQDPYTAPENRFLMLVGTLTSGERIVTSEVMSSIERLVRTKNSTYKLDGLPEKGYTEWLTKHGLKNDSKNPVKIKRK